MAAIKSLTSKSYLSSMFPSLVVVDGGREFSGVGWEC